MPVDTVAKSGLKSSIKATVSGAADAAKRAGKKTAKFVGKNAKTIGVGVGVAAVAINIDDTKEDIHQCKKTCLAESCTKDQGPCAKERWVSYDNEGWCERECKKKHKNFVENTTEIAGSSLGSLSSSFFGSINPMYVMLFILIVAMWFIGQLTG